MFFLEKLHGTVEVIPCKPVHKGGFLGVKPLSLSMFHTLGVPPPYAKIKLATFSVPGPDC